MNKMAVATLEEKDLTERDYKKEETGGVVSKVGKIAGGIILLPCLAALAYSHFFNGDFTLVLVPGYILCNGLICDFIGEVVLGG